MTLTRVKMGSTHFEAGTLSNGRPCIFERKMAGRGNRLFAPGTWRTVKTLVYRSVERRDENMQALAQSAEASLKMKAERKAERAKPHSFKVGDILVSSWGYDQTNVDFYTVVAITPHTVSLCGIAKELTPDGGVGPMSGHVQPATPIQTVGAPSKHRADSRDSVRLEDYAYARMWDGKPKYCSWYA